MDQDKSSVVPGDDNQVVTMTSTAISSWMSTVDLVEGLRARREAPTSWLEGVRSNYLVKLVTRALNAYLTLYLATRGAKLCVKLTKAIELYREAVVLLPLDHPNRADTCANLGCFLYAHYEWTRNVALLDEAIELQREALALRPLGHPHREISCVILSCSLLECYIRTGGAALLDESIRLQREALELRPPGHPDRALSCVTLGSSLRMSYQQVGDVTLLDEEIELEREALALQPPGHPNDRAITCLNLGSSLHDSYHQTGNVALLDEAIKLQREALESSPPGDPGRAASCSALAVSLSVRYQHAGDLTQLDEAIELHREALFLQPPGDPDRVNGCANLVTALQVRYPDQTSHTALLDEAIELKREALALQTLSRPDRAKSCDELASYLLIRYEPTGDVALLDEAIKLQREGLALRPPEHPNRAACYASLADSLHMLCKRTDNIALVNEAMDASSYASEHLPASKVWMSLSRLSQLYLLRSNPRYSILKALEHIHHSFQHEANDIRSFMYAVCHIAALVWDNSGVWSPQITALLVEVYAKIVDRLPLVAGFVLDMSSRLQSLKLANRIGSDACVAALLVEQPAAAVTLLDRAHGVIWTQALHQRDPRMEGAPRDLAGELEDLLRRIATSAPVDPARVPGLPQDFRYRQNIRIQALLREIRAMPGLERFMLGSTYETLREAARDHPVVVLVAARDHAFALIMSSSAHAGPDILRLDVANDTLQSFANSVEKTNLRYRGCTLSRQDVPLAESVDLDRAMRPGDHPTRRSPLARLWLSVVKPVLIHLGLTVCCS
jgi:tetratricopeptide (TPR) repeat protein